MTLKKPFLPLAAIGTAAAFFGWPLLDSAPAQAERAIAIARPAMDASGEKGLQTAILAGGCYWGMEGLFENVKGVKTVVSGFAGGTAQTANYAAVSSERTKHAEAIRITYDPAQISYGTLLRIYFSVAHDPTQLNQQTPDVGTSYRSAIFPATPQQDRVARAYIAQLGKSGAFRRPIVTTIETGRFYPAAADHQDFMRRNPSHPYIVRWDKPKLAAFKAGYPSLVR